MAKKETQNTRQAKRSRVQKPVILASKLTPKTANTNEKICKMKRDNISLKDYWLLVNPSSVSISKQRLGEKGEWLIEIPKRQFNRMIKFYETGE